MEKFRIIFLLNLLNIFSFSQDFLKLPIVDRSASSLQDEFNSLMEQKSSPKYFREYFKEIFRTKDTYK